MRKIKLNLKDVREKYFETKSSLKTGKYFNCSYETILKFLKKNNISIFGYGRKKYFFSETFFEQNTPESFYWAGFIAADGCVMAKRKLLTIALAKKDKNLLKKFKRVIQFDGPIREDKSKKGHISVSLRLCSIKILNDLSRFNIVPRKTLIYTFPEWLIDHSLVNHFMRGYFDGDGSVFIKSPSPSDKIKNRKIKKLVLSIRGTENFLNIFQHILIREIKVTKHKVSDSSSNVGQLTYSGNRIVPKIANFLYKDSNETIRLDRKYNLVKNFSDKLPKNFNYKPVKAINKNTGKILKFEAIKLAAESLNLRPQSITSCLIGYRKSYAGFIWEYIK